MSLFLSNFLQATYFKTDLWANGMYENLSSSGWWILPQLGLLYAYTFNYPFYGMAKYHAIMGTMEAAEPRFLVLQHKEIVAVRFSPIYTPLLSLWWIST